MRNSAKTRNIFNLVEKLPCFSIDDVLGIEPNKNYLKTLFSRREKSGKLIRIKKGLYVTKEYLDGLKREGGFPAYLEFVAGIIYSPCYLSMDYILSSHNLLTETVKNFTAVSLNKTSCFENALGNYFFHKIKRPLFCGYETINKKGLTIYRATAAKALFDYIYFRKNQLAGPETVKELRLNLKNLKRSDWTELTGYGKVEGSKKMAKILTLLRSQK
jgi:predicted transcriptional regulator of viral defense system